MNPSNVKLILGREIRDQLRDRRTLFVMFVLPILLYPILGMSFFQIAQFMREEPVRVLVVGAAHLPGEVDDACPPLVVNNRFSEALFGDPAEADLLQLEFARSEPLRGVVVPADPRAAARATVEAGRFEAALYFPEGFADELERFQRAIADGAEPGQEQLPRPEILYTTANEKSQIAFARLRGVLSRWTEAVGRGNLQAGGIPAIAARPFDVETIDVADATAYRGAAIWSKVLPVLLLIWALTGAFYPAIDLCAGEKERGTLETLLSSPAQRSEIVVGKLLTIMIFSMVTALLNLLSVGMTGWLVLGRLPQFGPPPPLAIVWLGIALVPMSALFSALCLALAALARSSKEGQYYLMPLLLVTLPLAVLPMAPGVELTLGTSLIPVAGVVLVLRSLLEGSYLPALEYLPAVVAVTLGSCLLAVRWAVDQCNSETVLFRESEQWDLGLWLRRLVADRRPLPTVGAAVFCGVVILLLRFLLSSVLSPPAGFAGFAWQSVVTQLLVVVAPALLLTVLLTRSPRQTLLVRMPPRFTLLGAVGVAVLLHPTVMAAHAMIQRLYPFSEKLSESLEGVSAMLAAAPLWQVLLLLALLPAVCEELAFRGFILSGFRNLDGKWRAIVYSAVIFGVSHAILQQALLAVLLGVVIGFLAVQTRSLLPGVAFHLVHNSLPLVLGRYLGGVLAAAPWLQRVVVPGTGGYMYHWSVVLVTGIGALVLLSCFRRLDAGRPSPQTSPQTADSGTFAEQPAVSLAECREQRDRLRQHAPGPLCLPCSQRADS